MDNLIANQQFSRLNYAYSPGQMFGNVAQKTHITTTPLQFLEPILA
jgi:hypothetical protein